MRHRRNRRKSPAPVRAGQVRGGRSHEVSCWDIPDVSESFAGGCRVANTRLKNRTEHAIFLSGASRRRPTTDQRGRLVTLQVTLILWAIGPSLATMPPRILPRWGQRLFRRKRKSRTRPRMTETRFPLSHRRNPGKRDDVGRHGAPT